MRKVLVLFVAIFLLAVAFQLPEGITGFFVKVTTSVLAVVKEVIKTVLITVANML
jgi:hypothetical protein